jgi:hypothetical protein
MAAFLADTIASSTNKNSLSVKGFPVVVNASTKPIRAKGMAKRVWENFTKEKNLPTTCMITPILFLSQ